MMLYDFLIMHRADLIARIRAKVVARAAPMATGAMVEKGVPLFLDQLAEVLRRQHETAGRSIDPEIGKSASRHGGGLGLGLTIARESIETNGGTIEARSVSDRGCVFTVELPVLRQEPSRLNAGVGSVPEPTGR